MPEKYLVFCCHCCLRYCCQQYCCYPYCCFWNYDSNATCIHGMNSQNIYWRIEFLHQRTLICILYEFFPQICKPNFRVRHNLQFRCTRTFFLRLQKNQGMQPDYLFLPQCTLVSIGLEFFNTIFLTFVNSSKTLTHKNKVFLI